MDHQKTRNTHPGLSVTIHHTAVSEPVLTSEYYPIASSFLASSSSRQSDLTKASMEDSPDHENENGVARTCRRGAPYKSEDG